MALALALALAMALAMALALVNKFKHLEASFIAPDSLNLSGNFSLKTLKVKVKPQYIDYFIGAVTSGIDC